MTEPARAKKEKKRREEEERIKARVSLASLTSSHQSGSHIPRSQQQQQRREGEIANVAISVAAEATTEKKQAGKPASTNNKKKDGKHQQQVHGREQGDEAPTRSSIQAPQQQRQQDQGQQQEKGQTEITHNKNNNIMKEIVQSLRKEEPVREDKHTSLQEKRKAPRDFSGYVTLSESECGNCNLAKMNEIYRKPGTHSKPLQFSPCYKAMVDLMRTWHHLAESIGVEYMLTGGALIGLERHGSLPPHEKDIDVWTNRKGALQLQEYSEKKKIVELEKTKELEQSGNKVALFQEDGSSSSEGRGENNNKYKIDFSLSGEAGEKVSDYYFKCKEADIVGRYRHGDTTRKERGCAKGVHLDVFAYSAKNVPASHTPFDEADPLPPLATTTYNGLHSIKVPKDSFAVAICKECYGENYLSPDWMMDEAQQWVDPEKLVPSKEGFHFNKKLLRWDRTTTVTTTVGTAAAVATTVLGTAAGTRGKENASSRRKARGSISSRNRAGATASTAGTAGAAGAGTAGAA